MRFTVWSWRGIAGAAALLAALAPPAVAGDMFDKAESAKDCIQNNNCEKHKWLGKFVAAKKCKEAGNCIEKVNEYAAKNRDKIDVTVSRVTTVTRCMNMKVADEAGVKDCYEKAKAYYRQRAAAKQEKAAREMYQFTEAGSCLDVKKVSINLVTIALLEACNDGAQEEMTPHNITALRNVVEESARSMRMMWLSCTQRCSQHDPGSNSSRPIPGCPDELAQKTANQALAQIPIEPVCQRYR